MCPRISNCIFLIVSRVYFRFNFFNFPHNWHVPSMTFSSSFCKTTSLVSKMSSALIFLSNIHCYIRGFLLPKSSAQFPIFLSCFLLFLTVLLRIWKRSADILWIRISLLYFLSSVIKFPIYSNVATCLILTFLNRSSLIELSLILIIIHAIF